MTNPASPASDKFIKSLFAKGALNAMTAREGDENNNYELTADMIRRWRRIDNVEPVNLRLGHLQCVHIQMTAGQPSVIYVDEYEDVVCHVSVSPLYQIVPGFDDRAQYPVELVWPQLRKFEPAAAAKIIERAISNLHFPDFVKQFEVIFRPQDVEKPVEGPDNYLIYRSFVLLKVPDDVRRAAFDLMRMQLRHESDPRADD